MRIEVVRSGGFAGISRRAVVDTADHPGGARLEALVAEILAAPPAPPHRPIPDGFSYDITAGSRTFHCADPHLTPPQRELIRTILNEGA